MFNLFKRKNKIKELEMRVLVLESNITKLNDQKEKVIDFSKSWGEGINLKGYTFEGIEIKDTKFMDELAKKVSRIIEENKEKQNENTGDVILQIDGDVVGKVALNQLNKMQRQCGVTVTPV